MEYRLNLYLSGVALLIVGSCLIYAAGSLQQSLQQAYDKQQKLNTTQTAGNRNGDEDEEVDSVPGGARNVTEGGSEDLADVAPEGLDMEGALIDGVGLEEDVSNADSPGQEEGVIKGGASETATVEKSAGLASDGTKGEASETDAAVGESVGLTGDGTEVEASKIGTAVGDSVGLTGDWMEGDIDSGVLSDLWWFAARESKRSRARESIRSRL